MKTTGIVIIIIGIVLTIFTTFKFFTREKIVDIGNLEITRDKPNTFSWSPIVGVLTIGLGAVVLWQASKKTN
ncbi:MAG: hypothetical protein Q8J88_17885 [Bacteroidales bacterium]|nr:hypothetical protein [Bacteroidales bacterium]